MNWIKTYCFPKKLPSDNGGDFNNELFKEMASFLGIELLSTAAERPLSNEITERHNSLLDSCNDDNDFGGNEMFKRNCPCLEPLG